jgi:glycosyltransferase involved in cell wall biosynthesis
MRSVDRPRVAYVLPWPCVGGGEISTFRLATSLAGRGHVEPIAFCCGPDSEIAQKFRLEGIDTHVYTAPEFSYRHPMPYVQHILALRKALRRHHVSLVHCSDLMGANHAALAARLNGLPVLCHIRSNFPDQISRRHTVPFRAVSHFAFVSKAARRNFARILRVPESRGTVVYNWAPAPRTSSPDAQRVRQLRAELGCSPSTALVAMFARVAPQKDFETLIDAMALVVAEHPAARLALVGEHERPEACRLYHRRLRERIAALTLESHVVWTGFRKDVDDLVHAADIVVLATHDEGFGLAIVEAMIRGRPVVATNVGGVPEIIDDGETGVLHEHGDSRGLARAIVRLIGDPQLARALGERAQRAVRVRFSEDQTLGAVCTLYDRLLRVPETVQ